MNYSKHLLSNDLFVLSEIYKELQQPIIKHRILKWAYGSSTKNNDIKVISTLPYKLVFGLDMYTCGVAIITNTNSYSFTTTGNENDGSLQYDKMLEQINQDIKILTNEGNNKYVKNEIKE